MTKLTTFISDQGEIFEGSRAALIRERGIKNQAGFVRRSGALDADGDRWLSSEALQANGGEFIKKVLYLGPRQYYGSDHLGRKTQWIEDVCDTAFKFNWYSKCLRGDVLDFDEQYIPVMQAFIKRIQSSHTIIDNNLDDNPFTNRIEALKDEMRAIKNAMSTLDARDCYGGTFHWVVLSEDEKLELKMLKAQHDELLAERIELSSKSGKWQSAKLNEANNASAIAKYERDNDEPMCPRRQAAMRGQLHEYDKSVALSMT